MNMKKLLIVVDLLNDFCHHKGVLAQSNVTGLFYGEDIVPYVAGVVDSFRRAKDPIVWLGDWHKEDDLEFKRFPPHAVRDTWGALIVEDLLPDMVESSPNELKINKTRYSGFYLTSLESTLFQLEPDLVTVIGVCTSICVMDTVGGLANRDYETEVLRHSVADFDPGAGEKAMTRMSNLYGAKIIA
jgi:nicotinamidase/pyrazinamidase